MMRWGMFISLMVLSLFGITNTAARDNESDKQLESQTDGQTSELNTHSDDETQTKIDFKYKVTTMQGDKIEFSEASVVNHRLYIHMKFTLNPTAKKPVAIYSLFTKDQYYRFENAFAQVEFLKLTHQKLEKEMMKFPPLISSTIAQPGQTLTLTLAYVFPEKTPKIKQLEFVEAWSADPDVSAIKINY